MSVPDKSFVQNIKWLIVAVVCVLYGVVNAQYQPAKVEISKEKTIIDGTIYYLHTIKERQTFYSICKAYNVDRLTIIKANPGLIPEQLSNGQVIRIPYLKDIPKGTESLKESDYYYHTVKAKQTLYYLHDKYQVSIDLIKQHNPEIIGNDIKEGQVIRIPKNRSSQSVGREQIASVSDTNFYLYEVQQGETLYALSKRFEVSIPQLINNNKNLRYGLKYGTILRIPKTRGVLVAQQIKKDSTIELGVEKLTCLQCDSIRNSSTINKVKVAVLLPFMASKFLNDEKNYHLQKDTLPENVVLNKPQYDDRFLEFYEGLLLSIDSLKNTGKNIALFTYDTKKDTSFLDTVLSELNILSPDLVIGPVYPNLVRKVSDYCNQKGWMHVLPFSRGALEENNHPTSIHGILPADVELEKISTYLATNTSGLYYLVYKNNERDSIKASMVDSLITSKKIANGDSVKIYHITDFENLEQELSSKFDSAIQKLVIPISNSFNQPEVVSIYSTLNNLALTSDITIIGHFSWQGYSSLRVEPFHRFNTILLTPFYLNYNHDLSDQLIRKSRDFYRYEPHQLISNGLGLNFTYYGYEIGLSLIGAYYDFTLDMLHCMPCYKTDLMQSSYKFVPFRNGYGYYNSSYTILKYADDFTVNVIDVN